MDSIQGDLLNAHANALVAGENDYYSRYEALFPEEMAELDKHFETAEHIYALLRESVPMRAEFRADLKAGLIAQAHQQRLARPNYGYRWRWAALGASVTVAGVIAAAAWRGSYSTQ